MLPAVTLGAPPRRRGGVSDSTPPLFPGTTGVTNQEGKETLRDHCVTQTASTGCSLLLFRLLLEAIAITMAVAAVVITT